MLLASDGLSGLLHNVYGPIRDNSVLSVQATPGDSRLQLRFAPFYARSTLMRVEQSSGVVGDLVMSGFTPFTIFTRGGVNGVV